MSAEPCGCRAPRSAGGRVRAVAGSARFGPAAPVPTGGAAAVTVLSVTLPPLKFRTRWSR
ncbi:hypothetical protein [Streptomyces sp. AC555_RSS877]|uniref:hypothetical protein n=1 Tax=Streptomyces sp. AC555_RSS877 TaxID=2823688 RepID=UPI001C27723D|nr:hypothetical protein [Streptomyces sp. AC555_RSS877]